MQRLPDLELIEQLVSALMGKRERVHQQRCVTGLVERHLEIHERLGPKRSRGGGPQVSRSEEQNHLVGGESCLKKG